MKQKMTLICINVLTIALTIGHLVYEYFYYDGYTAVNIGLASFYAVALCIVDIGVLLAWLITKKKQPKFKVIFLVLNAVVLLAMIASVIYALASYDPSVTSASQDVYFLLALLFLPPLFVVDLFSTIVYWLWQRKRPKFDRIFLVLNIIVLIVMILYVCGVTIRSNYSGASQDACYLVSFLFLPPLFITDLISVIIYLVWKKKKIS